MTNNDKLKALIDKAIEGGWHDVGTFYRDGQMTTYVDQNTAYALIFNHNFAKALFGEPVTIHPTDTSHGVLLNGVFEMTTLGWKDHLKRAVVSEDPISYMYGVVYDNK